MSLSLNLSCQNNAYLVTYNIGFNVVKLLLLSKDLHNTLLHRMEHGLNQLQ